jgi:hypothetical protein
VNTRRALLVVASVALLSSACGHDIGDSCKTAADCDPNGTRTCDLSQPGGYCTMAGCDEKSCPSGSVCIRYFPENLVEQTLVGQPTKICNVECEDVGVVDKLVCPQGPTNDCAGDELCLASGLCAKRTCKVECEDVGADAPSVCPDGKQTNDCAADEVCLNSGVCAKRSFETRSCAYTCGGNGDCRGGYDCWPVASTGISMTTMMSVAQSQGMMLLGQSPTAVAKVCAPKPSP